MRPDARLYDPHPDYLRELVDRTGLSQRAAARAIGISERAMRQYLADPATATTALPAPYPVQYALEQLGRSIRR